MTGNVWLGFPFVLILIGGFKMETSKAAILISSQNAIASRATGESEVVMRIELDRTWGPRDEFKHESDEPVLAFQYDGDQPMFSPALARFFGAEFSHSGQNKDCDHGGEVASCQPGVPDRNMKSGWPSLPLYVLVAMFFAMFLPVMFPLFLIGIIRMARRWAEQQAEQLQEVIVAKESPDADPGLTRHVTD